MVGHQLFLRQKLNINRGHIGLAGSPWALVSVQQAQFWNRDLPRQYGAGTVQDILSTCISDWQTPGILFGKPAAACTREEIAAEVWAQAKAHLQGAGIHLTDDMIVSSFLDPAITLRGSVASSTNESPLSLNTVGCLDSRPTPDTQIPNLFVASDYVSTNMDVACMESASEAARRAVNSLLERAGLSSSPAQIFPMFDPPEFRALKDLDAALYRSGQPHLLDTGQPLVDDLFGLQPTSGLLNALGA